MPCRRRRPPSVHGAIAILVPKPELLLELDSNGQRVAGAVLEEPGGLLAVEHITDSGRSVVHDLRLRVHVRKSADIAMIEFRRSVVQALEIRHRDRIDETSCRRRWRSLPGSRACCRAPSTRCS